MWSNSDPVSVPLSVTVVPTAKQSDPICPLHQTSAIQLGSHRQRVISHLTYDSPNSISSRVHAVEHRPCVCPWHLTQCNMYSLGPPFGVISYLSLPAQTVLRTVHVVELSDPMTVFLHRKSVPYNLVSLSWTERYHVCHPTPKDICFVIYTKTLSTCLLT